MLTTEKRYSQSPYFRLYEAQLRQLHDLVAAGLGDSPEAEALREEMEAPERMLGAAELEHLNGLSADLYSLTDDEIYEPEPVCRTADELRAAIQVAWANRDWPRLLKLLREGQSGLSPDQVAFLRAQAYDALGHPETALLFQQKAAQLNPDYHVYHYLVIDYLLRLGRLGEAIQMARPLLIDGTAPFFLRIQASAILQRASIQMNPAEARLIQSEVLKALPTLVASEDFGVQPANVQVLGLITLAFCQAEMGQVSAAIATLGRAVSVSPDTPTGWALRGQLRLQNEPRGAMSDFEHAIQRGTQLPIAYLVLAHEELINERFEQCLELCQRGSSLSDGAQESALFHYYAALARWGSGADPNRVRQSFESALRLDPLNSGIREHYELFASAQAQWARAVADDVLRDVARPATGIRRIDNLPLIPVAA